MIIGDGGREHPVQELETVAASAAHQDLRAQECGDRIDLFVGAAELRRSPGRRSPKPDWMLLFVERLGCRRTAVRAASVDAEVDDVVARLLNEARPSLERAVVDPDLGQSAGGRRLCRGGRQHLPRACSRTLSSSSVMSCRACWKRMYGHDPWSSCWSGSSGRRIVERLVWSRRPARWGAPSRTSWNPDVVRRHLREGGFYALVQTATWVRHVDVAAGTELVLEKILGACSSSCPRSRSRSAGVHQNIGLGAEQRRGREQILVR